MMRRAALIVMVLAILILALFFWPSGGDKMLGSGTAEDPYQVATAGDLDDVRNNMSAYYIQTADIDLSGIDFCPIGSDFSDSNYSAEFTGHYDGQNHIINNLTINCGDGSANYNLDEYYDGFGLFYQIGDNVGTKNGEVKNLQILNCSIKGFTTIGIVCGYNRGKIDNVTVSGNIEGYYDIGGIAGYSREPYHATEAYADITNCKTDIEVNLGLNPSEWSCGNIGGIAGITTSINVSKCETNLIFHDDNPSENSTDMVGGLAGWTYGYSQIINGINYFTPTLFKECSSAVDLIGRNAVGVLIGENSGAYLEDCFGQGVVNGNEGIGGITGIDNSTNELSKYKNVYCAVPITSISTSGPFIGLCDNAVIENCYYDSEICGVVDNGFGVGKTTAEMKTQETFVGWDFANIWVLNAGQYPTFRGAAAFDCEPPTIIGPKEINCSKPLIELQMNKPRQDIGLKTVSVRIRAYADAAGQILITTVDSSINPELFEYSLHPVLGFTAFPTFGLDASQQEARVRARVDIGPRTQVWFSVSAGINA